MFDCKQDIGLLHGSLISAAYSNSGSLFNCADVNNAVNIVYDSVKIIIHHILNGIKDEKDKVQIRLHSNERLHAAIFFTTLRSHGITSKSADDFYGSIVYNWPTVDFKFYVELSFKCDWSEYFIKCVLQLPSKVLYKVLKLILDIPFPRDVEYYSWHLVMQTVILKLLHKPCVNEVKYPFCFDFSEDLIPLVNNQYNDELYKENKVTRKCEEITMKCNKVTDNCPEIIEKYNGNTKENKISDSDSKIIEKCDENTEKSNKITENEYEMSEKSSEIVEENNEIAKEENMDYESDDIIFLKEMFNNLCDCISEKMKEPNEIDALKILLHCIKTLLKSFIAHRNSNCTDISQFSDFLKIYEILSDHFKSNTNYETLKIALQNCSNTFVSHAYATTSWNISLNYLIVLLTYYIHEIYADTSSCLSYDDDITYTDMICVPLFETLKSLNSPFIKSDEHLKVLCKIIQLGFQGSPYAAKFLLSEPASLVRDDVLTVLEENTHVISFSLLYPMILLSVKAVQSQESKLRLLKMFYKLMRESKIGMYNTILRHILSTYGLTEEFQLPDFNEQLSKFSRETPSLKEAEEVLPSLFIQNPMSVLKFLTDQVIVQGSKGKLFIEMLKHFQYACFYLKNSDSVCTLLHGILNEYFEKKLDEIESKNVVTLYEFLVEVHLEKPILCPYTFFKRFIIPKLVPGYEKIDLILKCAYVLMPVLLSDESFLSNSELLRSLVISCGTLLHHCIVAANRSLKSLVVTILKELELHQLKSKHLKDEEKNHLWSTFKNMDVMACAYIKEFLPKDTEFMSKSFLWTWCCKNEDFLFFEENISFESLTSASLVNILIEVLPHLTNAEFLFSIQLIEFCCKKHPSLKDEIMCSNNPFQLSGSELDTYVALVYVITTLHFILKDDNINKCNNTATCFCSVLRKIVKPEETVIVSVHMQLSIFLQMCYLVAQMKESSKFTSVFSTNLLDFIKQLKESCSDESEKYACEKLILDAVFYLPDSYVKDHLSKHLK